MRGSSWHGAALVAALVMVAGGGPALAKDKPSPALDGSWRLDASRSRTPSLSERPRSPRMGGMGRGGRGFGGGGWGGGRMGGGRRGGYGGYGGREAGDGEGASRDSSATRSGRAALLARALVLPPLMRVSVQQGLVRFADSTGTELAEIVLASAATSDASTPLTVKRLSGEWKGDQLRATSEGARGAKIAATLSLKHNGSTLEIRTKVQPPDGRPALEFKQVYERTRG